MSSVYESTSVSRIVGSSPDELARQLTQGDLSLDDAVVVDYKWAYSEPREIVSESFPSHFSESLSNYWIENTGNKLVVVDSYPYKGMPAFTSVFDTGDVESWSGALDAKQSLFLVNSEYAGLSLPKLESIANTLTPHAAMIAPTAYASQQFLKTVICNLGNGDSLGDVFAQARNNYHWNLKDSNELIGLTLLSYALYGNPLVRVTVPVYDNSVRERLCKGITEDFTMQSVEEYRIQAVDEAYVKTIKWVIPYYDVVELENFTLITIPGALLQESFGELVLPVRTTNTEFPLKTIITGAELVGFSDPVDVTANVPLWNGFGYSERDCDVSNASARIDFSRIYSDESLIVLGRILPVEMIDCDAGKFRLYRTITYNITYYPFSPVRIISIDAPQKLLPEATRQITVKIENMQDTPTMGNLTLLDSEGTIISVKEISTTISEHSLELKVPAEEGTYKYYVAFVQDGEEKTHASFSIDVKTIEVEFEIPQVMKDGAKINLSITNNWETQIVAQILLELSRNGEQVKEISQEVVLRPGQNKVVFELNNLDRNDVYYDLRASITYNGRTILLSDRLLMNHAPVILNTNQVFNESQTLIIEPVIKDVDGDEVETEIIAPFNVDGTHVLTFEESGTYLIKIRANDGFTISEHPVMLIVLNTNRPPELDIPDFQDAVEGDEFTLIATATDPDNENNVDNDDNNLTIFCDYPLEDDCRFVPDYDSPRELNVSVTVTDGEFSVTKTAKIRIANTNRPPRIMLPDVIASDYDIDLAHYVNVSDPDNENDDPSDDNQLSITYAAPFGFDGRWTPPQPGLVFTTVKVTDGEFIVSKNTWINVSVTHPMPQPPYTYPEYNNTPEPMEQEPPASTAENQTTTPPANQMPENSQQQNQTATPPSQNTTQAVQPAVQNNGLEIEMTAKANGRKKKVNGDTSLKVSPDSEVKLEISLKNNGNTTKKITIEAGIEDLDEEEKETITLKPGDDEELDYEFFIPRLTDEDEYELKIIIRENGMRIKKTLLLRIDKQSHEISIRKAKATACNDNGRITVRLENTGSNEEKGNLLLESKSLGLERKIPFLLDEGEYKTFDEPFLVEEGTHTIIVTAEYGKYAITRDVLVEGC
ncbi:MAG: hypothetical protein QXR48_02320 [Candidatus Woesearchaeota archaeon]